MAVDTSSEKNIRTLRPSFQPLARQLIEAAVAQGINAKVICASRTYAEQNALYAQGRTKPGKIVTKARGGYSWHNFGLAFDIGIFSSGDSPARNTPCLISSYRGTLSRPGGADRWTKLKVACARFRGQRRSVVLR